MSSLLHLARPSGAPVVALSHLAVLDALFAAMAMVLVASYALVISYGVSILVLSVVVTAVTTPPVAWGWRSQLARASLEPQLADLRRRHRHDAQRLTSETAALFKEHGVSPWAGFLLALLPAPVYLSAYAVIRGLTHRVGGAAMFHPLYLPHSSRLFHALATSTTMRFWGVDLARTGAAALQLSPLSAGLFLVLVAVTVGASMWQQHLVRSALPTPSAPGSATARRAALLLPALFALWGLALPLGVTLYYAAMSTARVMQQWLLVRGHLW